MPHLILEYSSNLVGLSVRPVLAELNATLLKCGAFQGPDIKSRAFRADDFLIGEETNGSAFAHVTLRLLSGRTSEARRSLAMGLLQVLTSHVRSDSCQSVQLTVEVVELDSATYAKSALLGTKPS